MFPYGESVTRQRGTATTNPYSGQSDGIDWSSPTTLVIEGCAFDPGGSIEPAEVGRTSVVTQPTVYAVGEVDVTAHDRLIVRGRTWQVDGDPGFYRNPFTGWEPGTVIRLKAVDG